MQSGSGSAPTPKARKAKALEAVDDLQAKSKKLIKSGLKDMVKEFDSCTKTFTASY